MQDLSTAVGLSPAATTVLVDRLEAAVVADFLAALLSPVDPVGSRA